MVAVRNHEAERFLARAPSDIVLYLLFGSDAGLVSERARAIARRAVDDSSDPFQLVRMQGDAIAADKLALADEAHAIGLFGGRRAILIEAGGRDITPALLMILGAPPKDCTLVVEAGALRRDAVLRRLAERAPNAAAIECHPDGPEDVARLIDGAMQAAGLRIEPDARAFLGSLLGADRLTTRAELDKLTAYAHGATLVTRADVEAIVADASAVAQDEMVGAAFRGDFAMLGEAAARLFSSAAEAAVALGAALRFGMTLHRALLDAEAGGGRETAFASLARGRDARASIAQLARWRIEAAARAIEGLAQAVRRTRREPWLAKEIALRALWAVALAAPK